MTSCRCPGDRVALVIGDVMGHGLPEAVIMGRLRTVAQTLPDLDLPPEEIMGHRARPRRGPGHHRHLVASRGPAGSAPAGRSVHVPSRMR